jgi:hypothetical protein
MAHPGWGDSGLRPGGFGSFYAIAVISMTGAADIV